MTSEAGSTPDPRSVTPTTSRAPSLTRFVFRATAGGVESLIQKRNANFPALAAVRLSKTMSYAPAAGRIVPDASTGSPKVRRYGFRLNGSAG